MGRFIPMKKRIILSISFLLLLATCKPKQETVKYAGASKITSDIKEYSLTDSIILPYKKKLENEMNTVLVYAEGEFTKAIPEGSLGNLVADIALHTAQQITEVDFCILNNGGLRAMLPKGDITKGKIFELMPFENELVVVSLSAEKMSELFTYIASKGGQPVAGISLTIKKDKTAKNILINNEPVNAEKKYNIVTTDYLANGGDQMSFFKNPLSIQYLNIKLRDAIVHFLIEKNNKNQTIIPYTDKRVANE